LYQSHWWNAASYYSFQLVKAIIQFGGEVIFIGKVDSPIGKKILENIYKFYDVNLFEKMPFTFYRNIKKVKDIIENEKVDYLIPISAPGHIIIGTINLFSSSKLPVIKVCLNNVPPIRNFLNKYLHNNLTDYFIFPGESTRVRYDAFKLKKYSILHAPLEITDFINFNSQDDLKEEFGIPKNKIIVSFVGRFSPEKGIFFLLEIIKSALKKSDDLFFILSGSEEQIKFAEVQSKLRINEIAHSVKIINKVDDVRKIISITDIGILSSRYSEYICRIAMEFMVFKKPIVAPNVNVIPEIVGNYKNGFIYELNNAVSASEYVLKLANDQELRKRMGENSYKRMNEKYSTSVFENQIKIILDLFL
jgi:glycosyltransferase involved in cell wall biosynthesis